MSDDLQTHLQKANRYVQSAKILATTMYPNGAVTDSYYAFFWVVRGLLYEKGILTKRHSGLRDMLNLHYVRPGEIPKQYFDDLDMLFDRRQLVDYDIDGELPLSEINECVAKAEEFLTFVKQKYA